MRMFALAGAIGAALAFFLDPQSGRRRRALARDRTLALFRGQRAAHLREEPKPQPDDVTLAHKVETEIFRDPDVPKGKIDVNAENGVIVLRGELDSPDLIDDLVAKARKVQGVQDVESLLHVSGTEAPTGKPRRSRAKS